jgi:predicted ATPase
MSKMIPLALRDAFLKKTLVPLLGAGVSMSVKNADNKSLFPSWAELLERGQLELVQQGKDHHAQITKGQIALGMFQEAADTIQSGLKGSLWHDFLRKTFSCDLTAIDPTSLSLPQKIWSLSNRVMTLNYDKVCEFSYKAHQVISFDSTQAVELGTFSRDGFDSASIWHIHGRVDNASSIILTSASYEKLYGEDDTFRAALNVLGGVFQSSTVLFIGCSLEDAEILSRIDKVHSLFHGNVPPHFALVHVDKADAIKKKLHDLPIEVIEFSNYGDPILEILDGIKPELENSIRLNPTNQSIKEDINHEKLIAPTTTLKAAVLIANPIDRRINDFPIIAEISKLKICKSYFPLTVKHLQELDSYDYVFIVSPLSKGRFIIEDEFMSSERVTVNTLTENMGQASLKGLFIFTDQVLIENDRIIEDIQANSYPVAVYPLIERAQLNSVFFKIFKRKTVAINSDVIFSYIPFRLLELGGKCENISNKTLLPDGIDPHSTRNFTGRVTDIQNVCRLLLTLHDSGSVLTIKAAGGTGKTALIQIVAVEASRRNLFADGIEFVDCEFVTDYVTIVKTIARFLQLDFAKDIKRELRELSVGDYLIILDNVETLLYLPEANQILDLISFLGEFVTVVVTSRETLKFENEKVYELRRLTTDEALELFEKNITPRILNSEEKKLIREYLVEELLDNNPLAIKLITKTIPYGKNFTSLIDELKNDVFGKLDDAVARTFDAMSDANVERKKSLYASINYSYARLNEKEKRAFEALSLFPDGVNMELFKRIAQDSRSIQKKEDLINNQIKPFLVTDALLATLEGKSMIQSNNGHVRLQSLIGKFAEHKLQERDAPELTYIYENFFNYVSKFAIALSDHNRKDTVSAGKIFNAYQKNFIKGVLICGNINVSPEVICRFLTKILSLCVITSSTELLVKTLSEAKISFPANQMAEMSLNVITLAAKYYSGDFDEAYKQLQYLLPREKLLQLPSTSFFENDIALNTSWIYGMEGHTLDALIIADKHDGYADSYPDTLFQLGCIYPEILPSCDVSFFTLEVLLTLKRLNIDFLDNYIESLPKRHYVEIIQSNYVRVKLLGEAKENVSLMVTTNPYTKGIKNLMLALTTQDDEKKRRRFIESFQDLYHIKYYYVEALLFFCIFLKEKNDVEYSIHLARGLKLSRQYYFRYLEHQYLELESASGLEYKEEMYPLPSDRDYASSIKNLRKAFIS